MGTLRQGQENCNSQSSRQDISTAQLQGGPSYRIQCASSPRPKSYASWSDMLGLAPGTYPDILDPELGAEDKLQAPSLLWPAGAQPAVAGKDASPPLLVGKWRPELSSQMATIG